MVCADNITAHLEILALSLLLVLCCDSDNIRAHSETHHHKPYSRRVYRTQTDERKKRGTEERKENAKNERIHLKAK